MRIRKHILFLHEKAWLLVLYGAAMFLFGFSINQIFSLPHPGEKAPAAQEIVEATPPVQSAPPLPKHPKPGEKPPVKAPAQVPGEEAGGKSPPPEEMEETPGTAAEEVAAEEGRGPQEAEGGAIVEPEPEPSYSEYIYDLTVEKGDTLTDMLVEAGVDRQEANLASSSLQKSYDLRQLQVGQPIQVVFREGAATGAETGALDFALLRIEEADRIVELAKDAKGNFSVSQRPKELKRQLVHAGGVITDSLYTLANSLGIPYNVLQESVNAYSFDVDFQRDIKQGNRFEVLYEAYFDASGKKIRDGSLVYALLTVGEKDLKIYRFSVTGDEKDMEYYTEDGQVLRKSLLKTPVNGAVISSPFGARKHPISGYTKVHKGVDFAAPVGTPVYAAGDGKIEKIGWNGGYGNYLRVWHDAEYATAYAHLSRFAKGMKRERRVRQGQVIAYVGTTGYSTGPHLHFEILHYGKQVNPMKVTLPAARRLAGKDLKALQARAGQVRQWLSGTATKQLAVPVDQPAMSAPVPADAKDKSQ